MKPLSPSQRDVLLFAATHGGMVRRNTRVTTEHVLLERGFIEKDKRIREPYARSKHIENMVGLVERARQPLEAGDWMKALELLESANFLKKELEDTCYWITDAGRKAVAK